MSILDILRRAAQGHNRRPGWESANPGAFTFAAGQARGPKKPISGLKAGAGGAVQQLDFGAPRGEVSAPLEAYWSSASEPRHTFRGAQGGAGERGVILPISDARAAALRGREPVSDPATVVPLDYAPFTVPEGEPLGAEEVDTPGVSYSAPSGPSHLAVQGSAMHEGGPLPPELELDYNPVLQEDDARNRRAGEEEIARGMQMLREGYTGGRPPTFALEDTGSSRKLVEELFTRQMQQRMMAQELRRMGRIS